MSPRPNVLFAFLYEGFETRAASSGGGLAAQGHRDTGQNGTFPTYETEGC